MIRKGSLVAYLPDVPNLIRDNKKLGNKYYMARVMDMYIIANQAFVDIEVYDGVDVIIVRTTAFPSEIYCMEELVCLLNQKEEKKSKVA